MARSLLSVLWQVPVRCYSSGPGRFYRAATRASAQVNLESLPDAKCVALFTFTSSQAELHRVGVPRPREHRGGRGFPSSRGEPAFRSRKTLTGLRCFIQLHRRSSRSCGEHDIWRSLPGSVVGRDRRGPGRLTVDAEHEAPHRLVVDKADVHREDALKAAVDDHVL